MTLRSRITGSPVLWMLVAVVGFASLPVFIWAGTRDMSPWLFVAVWFGLAGVMLAVGREFTASKLGQDDSRLVVVADLRAAKPSLVGFLVLGRAQWPLFAVAVTFADPAVVTVVFDAWPVLFGLITVSGLWRRLMLDNKDQSASDSERVGVAPMLTSLIIGSVGVALVVLSDVEELVWGGEGTLWGVLLAVAAMLSAGFDPALCQAAGKLQRVVNKRNETAVSAAASVVGQWVTAPLLVAVAVIAGDTAVTIRGLALATAAAAAQTAGNWCFQHANHLARSMFGGTSATINSLYYTVSVVALLLLVVSGASSIARPDLLIAGAAGVVAVNMVLHLDPEGAETRQGSGGYGYRALVLALWVSGVLVLFRDDWVPDSWQVWSVVEYWGILGLLATVFILVYSFRQSRVGELRRAADELMLGLYHEFNVMLRYSEARGGVETTGHMSAKECEECMERLRVIDSSLGKEFNDAYLELRRDLEKRTVVEAESADIAVAQRWSKLLVDVERLVGLRQQGRGFAEPAVLAMFAAVTAALAVVARPENTLEPFARWMHDSVSVTIAAAFLFLGFDLVDKRRAADTPIFRKVGEYAQETHGQPPGWRLELLFYEDRRVPQLITATLGAVLLIGAIAMLGFKWMT